MQTPFDLIKDLFLKNKIFIRNKKPLEAKVLAFFDYLEGKSLSGVVRGLEQVHGLNVCKASVSYWLNKIRKKIPIATSEGFHEIVAIDETVLKVNGKRIFVFAAIDVENEMPFVTTGFFGHFFSNSCHSSHI